MYADYRKHHPKGGSGDGDDSKHADYNAADESTKVPTMDQLVPPPPDTHQWYKRNYGCLKTDPTRIARLHTFPDAQIPRGIPFTPVPPMRITDGSLTYRTSQDWNTGYSAEMIDTERNHPQFAFRAGAPATLYQIGVESQLRRLDQPLGHCTQGVIPMDAPLFYNTVAPPTPVGVSEAVQNAGNPVAVMIRDDGNKCRIAADSVAVSMSGRRFNNPTRQDTMRMNLPFAPPGIGSGQRSDDSSQYSQGAHRGST